MMKDLTDVQIFQGHQRLHFKRSERSALLKREKKKCFVNSLGLKSKRPACLFSHKNMAGFSAHQGPCIYLFARGYILDKI